VLVLGARSQIAGFLYPRLARAGLEAVTWHHRQALPTSAAAGSAICLAPLSALPSQLPALHRAAVRRLIAFSTTSVFYKTASRDALESSEIGRIAEAERSVQAFCDARGIAWTLFRPTLVYGTGRDRNVAAIARFVRRFGFFPIAGGGRGLRQPVHADDLACACVLALQQPATWRKAYTLSGAEVLSYREMVESVFRQLGREPRVLCVPMPLLRAGIRMLRWIPGLHALSPEMADRMQMDLCFDHQCASRDFGFHPRGFQLDAAAVGTA
jgi:nucleoside-diphosphate-sugar epimerase